MLRRMGGTLEHRGPDDSHEWAGNEIGLAFRRLSIIDVAGGRQPILNEDGSAAIILNGEIYNHRELRSELEARGHQYSTRSDAESVIHLWEERGPACLEPLRGMFALAIWDAHAQTLFLARDRLGKKPLYYYQLRDGGLVFGSEIKAILQHPEVPREPDLKAIDLFLGLQYVPSPMTAFMGLNRIPPGHHLTWRGGRVQISRYWQLDFRPKGPASHCETKEEVRRLAAEAVRMRLESEVPLGAFLSGGVDSSAIVGLAAEALAKPLKTFSVGFRSAAHDESAYARLVAERFGTDHHELVITEVSPELIDDIVYHYDQPFGDSSAIPSFQVAQMTRQHVTVVLTGDGGDESFAGYRRYLLARYARYFGLPRLLRLVAAGALRPVLERDAEGRRLASILRYDAHTAYFLTLTHLRPDQRSELYSAEMMEAVGTPSYPPLDLMRSHAHATVLDAYQKADVDNYLPDDLLVKMDVATMAHSLEARSPFLDHKLMEFMAGVPASQRIRRGQTKHLLKEALRGFLPDEILDRRKMGFAVPLGAWLRTSLREQLTDTLLSQRSRSRGYFKHSMIQRMIEANDAGDYLYQYQLWDLFMLEKWHHAYIDCCPIPRHPFNR